MQQEVRKEENNLPGAAPRPCVSVSPSTRVTIRGESTVFRVRADRFSGKPIRLHLDNLHPGADYSFVSPLNRHSDREIVLLIQTSASTHTGMRTLLISAESAGARAKSEVQLAIRPEEGVEPRINRLIKLWPMGRIATMKPFGFRLLGHLLSNTEVVIFGPGFSLGYKVPDGGILKQEPEEIEGRVVLMRPGSFQVKAKDRTTGLWSNAVNLEVYRPERW